MIDFSWLVRSIHILAAAIWVGGSFIYLVVIIPALRKGEATPGVSSQIAVLFKRVVNYLADFSNCTDGGHYSADMVSFAGEASSIICSVSEES